MADLLYSLTDCKFQDYRKNKPLFAGWYIWRLPHKTIENLTVVFIAEYRLRGAGFGNVLSPEFDYWDGYRVLLPKGLIEWAEYNGNKPKSGKELLEVAGVDNAVCPFCKSKPAWRYGGRFIGSGPTDTKYFYLECCHWFNGIGSRMENPVEYAKKRNKALAVVNELANTFDTHK
jgi:hypothetical protein